MAGERAYGVARVLAQLVEQVQAALLAAVLFDLRDAAERAHRRGARFVGGQAGGHQLIDLRFEMEFEFAFQIGVDPRTAKHRARAQAELVDPAHSVASSDCGYCRSLRCRHETPFQIGMKHSTRRRWHTATWRI